MYWLLFPLMLFSGYIPTEKSQTRVEMAGTLYTTYRYYGGVQMGDYDPPLVPLANHTLYVLKWKDANSVPVAVTSFTSDEQGNFRVSLDPGTYGFAELDDLDSLTPGQFIPHFVMENTWPNSEEYTWEISSSVPFNLAPNSDQKVQLIRHHRSYCGICP